jgi:Carboxylesterase family
VARLRTTAVSALTAVLVLSPFSGFHGLSGGLFEPPSSSQETFKIACSTLPFESIKKARQIDQDCGIHGDTNRTADAPQAAQNAAKNNFCASGPVVLATNLTFRHLQSDTEANAKIECCGPKKLPSDRALLQNIHTTDTGEKVGEGTVVPLIGFVMKGKYSNTGKGTTSFTTTERPSMSTCSSTPSTRSRLVVRSRHNFLFGNNFAAPSNHVLTSTDLLVYETMSTFWRRFAETGDPNPRGLPVQWPPYRSGPLDPPVDPSKSDQHLVFGDRLGVANYLRDQQYNFWESFFFRSAIGSVAAAAR